MEQETIYNTKIITSGKRIEIYKYKGYIRKGVKRNTEGRRGKKDLTDEEKEFNRQLSKRQNLNNAKNKIVRLVSSNEDLISFITLTYKDNMQDIKKSKKQLNKFFAKLKKDFQDLKYLYVIEFQNRGAIHYHILTNFPTDYTNRHTFNENFSAKYWRYGFVDVRNLKSEGNTNIAKYISAYITADMYDKDLRGQRIYTTSRNLNKPIVTTMEMKVSPTELAEIEGYTLQFNNNYDVCYKNKTGRYRYNTVNYFDFLEG